MRVLKIALAGNISQSPKIGEPAEDTDPELAGAAEGAASAESPPGADSELCAAPVAPGALPPPPPPPPPQPAMVNNAAPQITPVSPVHIFLSVNSYSTSSRGPHFEHGVLPYKRHGMKALPD
jgi:hypothetical protein